MSTRECFVKIIYPCGWFSDRMERVSVNEQNRVTLHHGIDWLIDEGPKGRPFQKIWNDVLRVVFVPKVSDKEIVEIYVNRQSEDCPCDKCKTEEQHLHSKYS